MRQDTKFNWNLFIKHLRLNHHFKIGAHFYGTPETLAGRFVFQQWEKHFKQENQRVDGQGMNPCSDFPKYFMGYVARFVRHLPKP